MDDITFLCLHLQLHLHLHVIKMGGKKDAKAKSTKGKKTRKGGIVNQPEENSEHSEVEEVQEVDQEKSQEEKKSR